MNTLKLCNGCCATYYECSHRYAHKEMFSGYIILSGFQIFYMHIWTKMSFVFMVLVYSQTYTTWWFYQVANTRSMFLDTFFSAQITPRFCYLSAFNFVKKWLVLYMQQKKCLSIMSLGKISTCYSMRLFGELFFFPLILSINMHIWEYVD